MRTLVRFGSGSKLYTFPTNSQVTFSDDFDKLANKIIRLPGTNGGFRNLGTGRGQSTGGTVRVDNWLEFGDLVEASDKVDSLRQMADWGLQPLYMQPTYGPERFCFAALNSAALQQDVHNMPHLRQKVPVVFDVPDPFWLSAGTEIVWGGGALWGAASSIWGGSGGFTTITGIGNISVSIGGNSFTHARLLIRNSSGAAVSTVVVQRKVNGRTMDELTYTGGIPAGETLKIDSRKKKIRLALVNKLNDLDYLSPDWMRLEPGENTLKVIASGTLDVGIRYFERFR